MTVRTRYLVLIGIVWAITNIYFYKDHIIAGANWSFSTDKKTPSSIQVILLSYHRSGSSFMGELLSSCDFCSYFFEPLFYEDHIRHVPTDDAYRDNLRGIFGCQKKILDELCTNPYVWIVRKFGSTTGVFNSSHYNVVNLCKMDEMHVIKTIRLRMQDVAPLWQKIPNLKLVHLVRDPRAVYHSIHSKADVWSVEDRSPEQHCKDVYRDLIAARTLPPESYFLIRYEDIVRDTLNATLAIYAFLGRSVTPAVQSYIEQHTHAEADPYLLKEAQEYFSTYRNSSFQGDQWKTKLTSQEIKRVERSCRNVMELLGYESVANKELQLSKVPTSYAMTSNKPIANTPTTNIQSLFTSHQHL